MNGKRRAVSVIIPNWNGLRFLDACLRSLQQQTCPELRILVVDNASTDGSLEWIREQFPLVEILPLDRNYGFSEAVNRGILISDTDYIGLLNNDTECDSRWVESGLRTLEENPDIGYVACQVLDFYQRERLDSAGDVLTKTGLPLKRGSDKPASGEFLIARRVFGATAGAAFYRRELFGKVGLFDSGYFMYLEDIDWCLRAALMGIRCMYVPEARVYHIEGGSDPLRASYLARGQTERKSFHTPQRTYWITRNRVRLLAKNYPTVLLVRRSPWILWGFIKSGLFHALRSRLFGSYIRGLWHGLRELPGCLELRRQIQPSRCVTVGHFEEIILGKAQ
jgi:GT2 family glycosyltransferase